MFYCVEQDELVTFYLSLIDLNSFFWNTNVYQIFFYSKKFFGEIIEVDSSCFGVTPAFMFYKGNKNFMPQPHPDQGIQEWTK